jgi:hypothetical protein
VRRGRGLRLAAGVFLLATPLGAQEPRVLTGVEPVEVTVGDHFRSAVRVELPPGATVVFGELRVGEPLELVDTPRVTRAAGEATAVYTLVAWRVGEPDRPVVEVRVVGGAGEGERTAEVALRVPVVRSVLPEGEVQPRPTRDVLPHRRSGVRWLALLALLLALAGAAAAWRHARGDRAGAARRDEREALLAQLRALEEDGLIEAGEWDPFYVRLSAILRATLALRSPRLTRALTTAELEGRLAEELPAGREQLVSILSGADRVKFARAHSRREQALADLQAVRRWLGGETEKR